MGIKVSIVVPIYNMESYLGRCLDSLCAQTLREIEIIAVNDGSTDGTAALLEQYAGRDNRIVVVTKANGGVSSARNEGISKARGAYIGFVDPDDWVEADMYEAMYAAAVVEQADIVMCSYMREFGTHAREKTFPLPDKTVFRHDEVQTRLTRRLVGPLREEVAHPEYLDAWGTVWSKLYRTELIKDNQLAFVDLQVVGTNEDSLFNIHAFYHAGTFVFLNRPFYHYWRVNGGSVTSGYKPDLKEKWFTLYAYIESFLQEKGMQPEFHSALHNRICLNTLGLGLNTMNASHPITALQKIKLLRAILNDPRIRDSFHQFTTAFFPFVWKVFFLCAKARFAFGFYFMLAAIDRLRRM